MKNALHLGAAVAAATLMGVADNSEADPGSYGRMIQKAREDREAGQQTQELGRELANLTLDNIELHDELDATRAQVEELLKRLEITETTCEDATQEDGCPAGCTEENFNKQSFEYSTGTGHF